VIALPDRGTHEATALGNSADLFHALNRTATDARLADLPRLAEHLEAAAREVREGWQSAKAGVAA
jgi:hypothetical protein